MQVTDTLVMWSLGWLTRADILAWVAGIPLVAAAMVWLYVQWKQGRQLQQDLALFQQMKRHSIEYDLVLKTMKLSIWRIDLATRVVTFESDYRDAADSLPLHSGITADEVTAQLLPRYADMMRRGLADMVEGRTDDFHLQYEVKRPHTTGTYWGELYATVDKRGLDGKPLSIVGTSMRIDRQKEIERQLTEALERAEESDRLKSAFLANISHEIRTPLNAIVGFSDVLPMAQSEEERSQLVALIKQNNAHLLRLFDDMVNMSRLEAGSGTLNKTRFELSPLLEEVRARFAARSAETRVALQVEAGSSAQWLYTDRDRLREILNQYVDNALKFTAEGTVTMGCGAAESVLRIWVSDTGKGIPAHLCNEHLFERFVKVDEFIPGTGLGLSICRSMAVSLGGKVGVESELGQGSTFWVELPI